MSRVKPEAAQAGLMDSVAGGLQRRLGSVETGAAKVGFLEVVVGGRLGLEKYLDTHPSSMHCMNCPHLSPLTNGHSRGLTEIKII